MYLLQNNRFNGTMDCKKLKVENWKHAIALLEVMEGRQVGRLAGK